MQDPMHSILAVNSCPTRHSGSLNCLPARQPHPAPPLLLPPPNPPTHLPLRLPAHPPLPPAPLALQRARRLPPLPVPLLPPAPLAPPPSSPAPEICGWQHPSCCNRGAAGGHRGAGQGISSKGSRTLAGGSRPDIASHTIAHHRASLSFPDSPLRINSRLGSLLLRPLTLLGMLQAPLLRLHLCRRSRLLALQSSALAG